MSIEVILENLVKSIDKLTAAIELSNATPKPVSAGDHVAPASVSVASSPSLFANPEPVVPVRLVEVPQPAPVQAVPQPPAVVEAPAAPVMPAPPVFVAPVAAPAPTGAPFSDSKGLIDYVMSSYKAMGAEKGGRIQQVLVGLGYQNINDVKPEHYAALFAGIEALK